MVSRAVKDRIQELGGAIPLKCKAGNYWFGSDDYHYWKAEYPDVDITQEVVNLAAWLNNNPDKRPDKQGARWFVGAWIGKRA